MDINHRVTIVLEAEDGAYLSALMRSLTAIDQAVIQASGTAPQVLTSGDCLVIAWTERVD